MTSKVTRNIFVWVLLLGFLSSVSAEELWVRNRPFQGVVQGSGSEMMVEMSTFLQLMELQVQDRGDTVVIGGFPIPVEASGTIRLVPLRDVVDAAGLRLSRNSALGTVDVRAASAGTGSRGNWNSKESTSSSSGKKKGSKTRLEGKTFKVSVPGHLLVAAEASYLKGEPKQNARVTSLNSEDAAPNSTETAFLVSTEAGADKGMLTFSIVPGMSSKIAKKDETKLRDTVIQGVVGRGGTLKGKPKMVRIAGKRFHKFQYKSVNKSGEDVRNEFYMHFSPKNGVAFLALIEAPTRQFNRAAPQLRLVVRNLRIK